MLYVLRFLNKKFLPQRRKGATLMPFVAPCAVAGVFFCLLTALFES
jgi:hypothetical protein